MKKITIKITKEDYKKLKKNAKVVGMSPKKYLSAIASPDFFNGVQLLGGSNLISSLFIKGLSGVGTIHDKVRPSGDVTIENQGEFLSSIILSKKMRGTKLSSKKENKRNKKDENKGGKRNGKTK